MLRDSGHAGLLVVLDEVETVQRIRGDVRERWLNALRQLIDEIDSGRFPGLYLLITGTPAFFDGPQGVQRLAPLASRLATDFTTDARFDNPRAVQLRLAGFDLVRLGELGRRIRHLYAEGASAPERVSRSGPSFSGMQCSSRTVRSLSALGLRGGPSAAKSDARQIGMTIGSFWKVFRVTIDRWQGKPVAIHLLAQLGCKNKWGELA